MPTVATSPKLYVPVGKPVKVNLVSTDVIHGFFLPAFRVKRDVVPGMANFAWFVADKPGSYDLFCSQYCGTGHSAMITTVEALPEAEFADGSTMLPQEPEEFRKIDGKKACPGKGLPGLPFPGWLAGCRPQLQGDQRAQHHSRHTRTPNGRSRWMMPICGNPSSNPMLTSSRGSRRSCRLSPICRRMRSPPWLSLSRVSSDPPTGTPVPYAAVADERRCRPGRLLSLPGNAGRSRHAGRLSAA